MRLSKIFLYVLGLNFLCQSMSIHGWHKIVLFGMFIILYLLDWLGDSFEKVKQKEKYDNLLTLLTKIEINGDPSGQKVKDRFKTN